MLARVAALADVVRARTAGIDPRVPELPAVDDDPEQASYEIAALAPIGPLDAQRVLETVDRADDRLELLAACSTSTHARPARGRLRWSDDERRVRVRLPP